MAHHVVHGYQINSRYPNEKDVGLPLTRPAFSEPGGMRESGLERRRKMPRKRLAVDQIMTKLRQIEVIQG